jgi:hypothetical protein
MAGVTDWRRRLPALLQFAQVVAASQAAGAYEPQMMPAHQAAALAGRLARLGRMSKAAPEGALAKRVSGLPAGHKPAEPITLQKWLGVANLGVSALGMAGGLKSVRRAIGMANRGVLRTGRRMGSAYMKPKMADGMRAGFSGWGKFRRNPGRAALSVGRDVYNNRGATMFGLGTAAGAAYADSQKPPRQPRQPQN